MTSTEFFKQRVAKGLCGACGKPNDRTDKTTCLACSQKRAKEILDERKYYIDNHVCPRCCKNSLYGSEKACVECRAKNAEQKARYREENREKYLKQYSEWEKKHRAELEEQGLCKRCGKRKADDGYKTCSWCRAKRRVYNQSRTAQIGTTKQRRIDNGLCIWCENPIKEGYKICETHYQMNVDKAHKVDRSKMIRFQLSNRKVGG